MMDELIKIIIGISGTVLGGFLGYFIRLFIDHRLAIDRIKENIKLTEFNHAVSKFRAAIIYELSGLYPIEQGWNQEDFPRLYQSIPIVNSAAAEFRHFVTHKTDFDIAVKEYNNYCRTTKWDDISTLEFNMKGTEKIKPKDKFKNIVEDLLSFANKD